MTTSTRVNSASLLGRLRRGAFPWLMVADGLVIFGLALVISVVRFGGRAWPTEPLGYTLVAFGLAAVIHVVCSYLGGLYEREPRLARGTRMPRLASVTLVAVLIDVLVAFLTRRYLMPTVNLGVLLLLAPVALTALRMLAGALRLRRDGPPRVLLVGSPEEVRLAREHLSSQPSPAILAGETGAPGELLRAVTATGATDVLLMSGEALAGVYPEPLAALERLGVGMFQRISARDTLLGLRGLCDIAGMPFVPLRVHALPACRARLKRACELLGLALLSPLIVVLLAAVAAYVRAVAGSPVLFSQLRVGRDGALFWIRKFRTMRPDAEDGLGPVLAGHADARVLPGCRWLRDLRLDELPQAWNVVRGEMSVVGPRPERPELTALYEVLIPGYARRHEIPPGITGLAQISGRYHTDPDYKLGYDLQYLVNWSPVLDLQILARTIWVVLKGAVGH